MIGLVYMCITSRVIIDMIVEISKSKNLLLEVKKTQGGGGGIQRLWSDLTRSFGDTKYQCTVKRSDQGQTLLGRNTSAHSIMSRYFSVPT